MHEWPLGMFPLTWPVCTKTNLFVEYSVNGKTMKHRGSTFFVTHFSAEAYLPFGSDVFQLPTCNHVVKKNFETFSGIFFTWVDDLRTPRGQWTMRKMLLIWLWFSTWILWQNHTIRTVKFLSKNSILTKPPKLQHFHEFFTKIFFDNFCREIKVVNS